MRIKKAISSNEYIRAGNVLVRNFTKKCVSPICLSHMYDKKDYQPILKNEERNKKHAKISDEKLRFRNVVIVSNGYKFEERHKFLSNLPSDVCVLTVNGALKGWKIAGKNIDPKQRKSVNAHVVNNPYRESLMSLPERESSYYPVCISSIRTHSDFCERYQGDVYTYVPTPERVFGYERNESYFIDDYRNPICAAIGLSYQFDVRKLLLLCCDDSLEEKKINTVQLENGLWTYPHHLRSQEIIDANLYWLTHQDGKEVKVGDFSSGNKYNNAEYISSDKDALDFFVDQEE